MEKLNFNIETYEGPLDLLLSLIKKNEMSIFNIQIHVIFKQFMEYLELMEKLDIDIAGDFITMAAELMLIKSQMLLPRTAEEDTPLKLLQMELMEYDKAKKAAEYLRGQWSENKGAVTREPQEPERGLPLHYEISVLERAFRRMLARSTMMKEMQKRPEQTLENLLKHKVTPIPQKVISVMRYLYKHGETDFETILMNNETRSDLIATFAAVLELVKFQRVFLTGDEEIPTLTLNMSHDIGKNDEAGDANKPEEEKY